MKKCEGKKVVLVCMKANKPVMIFSCIRDEGICNEENESEVGKVVKRESKRFQHFFCEGFIQKNNVLRNGKCFFFIFFKNRGG